MLDTKYGLKYSMPHSVVHIVDNSIRQTGSQPIVVDDPSLYATIVVTGSPMGVDNEVITVNRSDVLNVSFGLNNLTANDISKYGQSVTYPASLLNQGVPIKLMRITPEGSTYAFSCLLIQWRWDANDSTMHVRYKTTSDDGNNGLPPGVSHASFKNPARLNAALVKYFKRDDVVDGEGNYWKQRVFMTSIAAGRGKTYNYFNYAINQTQQSRRPANVRYLFSTIDTRTSQAVEKFHASLVNQNNASRVDYVETVNVQVNKRVKGSSILIPTINEAAVNELYNEYMDRLNAIIIDNVITDADEIAFVKDVYATTNINIFDPIYGRYIYNGDTDVKLPFMQVDMFDLDIPQLEKSNRITVVLPENERPIDYADDPTALYDKLTSASYGITNADDAYHVGDAFVVASTSPVITMITTINQYTGSVTSIPITSIKVDGEDVTFKGTLTFTDQDAATKNIGSVINGLIGNNKLSPNKDKKDAFIIAYSDSNTFTVAYVAYKDGPDGKITCDTGEGRTILLTQTDVYKNLKYPETPVSAFATSAKTEDPSWSTPGATIIDEGVVYVNGYDRTSDSGTRIVVNSKTPFKVGTCTTSAPVTKDLINTSYDVLMYDEDAANAWSIDTVTLPGDNNSSGYEVGIEFTVEDLSTESKFKVTAVDEFGKVTAVEVVSSKETVKVEPGTTYTAKATTKGSGLKIVIGEVSVSGVDELKNPNMIQRYIISGTTGSIYRVGKYATEIPSNYYSKSYGINPSSEAGGIAVENGYAGFFDDDISEIEYKYRYSERLVQAFRGEIDPRILSPTRVPAKYLFDGGFNTIIGQTILPYIKYEPVDIINASTIFTEDEKEAILLDSSIISDITEYSDIDVKQAMYDLMDKRCYQGIPESKRPIGPGSGLSLHLDSGVTDATTALAINQSFIKRFSNPNASWDIGGFVSSADGISYTYTKRIVDNLFAHMKRYNVNKPFTGKYTNISASEYISFFPDIDATDWEMRELLYNSGGNAWVMDVNGNLQRKSQRTLHREGDTSDLIQENNMRTLSQLTYLLQNKIDSYLLEYNDDGVLKTLKDDCDTMFTNWVGNYVQALDIRFERDIDPNDGGEIVVCYCSVTFRGLILRVPIIVNVQRRTTSES